MVAVLALTQFAFLALAVVAMKIVIQANGGDVGSHWLRLFNDNFGYLFLVPLLWVFFARVTIVFGRERGQKIAQAVGVVLAVACFAVLAAAALLPPR